MTLGTQIGHPIGLRLKKHWPGNLESVKQLKNDLIIVTLQTDCVKKESTLMICKVHSCINAKINSHNGGCKQQQWGGVLISKPAA